MATRTNAVTVVADEVKDVLRTQMSNGWSVTRIAYEMNRQGHQWTEATVRAAAKPGRFITVDEAVGLCAIFKANAQFILKAIDKIAVDITRNGKQPR